ncbi:integrase/recombinase xerD homolog [Dysidea avara]|uniref:integrase/recombinase xerD homolog n=1 Tax=Dysidea avara TaxID=196820 RepID=UPI003316CCE8
MEDPHLKCLAKSLFTTVLNSKAPSTTKKYMYAFNRWRKWAQSLNNIDVFPVKPVHLALYLQHLGDSKQSRAAVEEASYAIAWIHQMAGLPSPSSNPLVLTTLSGLRRSLAQPVVRKEPITPDMLEAMVRACGANPTLADVRFLAVCLLGFAAFLRYEELSNLKCSDVLFFADHMEIKIRSSKTDQLRQGDRVYVACSSKVTCPVTMLKRYMDMGGLSSSSGILFRPLAKGGWNPLGSLSQILEFTALDQEVLLLQLKLEYQTDYSRGMVVGPQIAPRMAMLRTQSLLSWELHKD